MDSSIEEDGDARADEQCQHDACRRAEAAAADDAAPLHASVFLGGTNLHESRFGLVGGTLQTSSFTLRAGHILPHPPAPSPNHQRGGVSRCANGNGICDFAPILLGVLVTGLSR